MKFLSKPLIISVLMFSVSTSAIAAPENYKFDPNHTAIVWQVNHFGFSNPSGKFMDVDGVLVLDEAKPENTTLDVIIPVTHINSGVAKLDTHLQAPEFFDTLKFPTATFKSTKVEITGKDTAKVTGDLTLKGVTKLVTLDVKLNKIGMNDMMHKKVAGFSATTTIKRSDFGVSYAVPMVSDEVKLSIEAEADKVE